MAKNQALSLAHTTVQGLQYGLTVIRSEINKDQFMIHVYNPDKWKIFSSAYFYTWELLSGHALKRVRETIKDHQDMRAKEEIKERRDQKIKEAREHILKGIRLAEKQRKFKNALIAWRFNLALHYGSESISISTDDLAILVELASLTENDKESFDSSIHVLADKLLKTYTDYK